MKSIKAGLIAIALLGSITPDVSMAAPEYGIDKNISWFTNPSWQLPEKPIQFKSTFDGSKIFTLTNDNKVNVFTPNGILIGSIPVDKGVKSFDIDVYGNELYLYDSAKNTYSVVNVSLMAEIAKGTSPYLGPEDAPVTITIFTAFT